MSGINALVKTNRLSRKMFLPRLAFTGLKAAGGTWGGLTPSGTIRDQRFGQKEPFEPKKSSGLVWPSPASRPLEGPGGQTPSGAISTPYKLRNQSVANFFGNEDTRTLFGVLSLRKTRCHLMGGNDSSGKLGRWPM